MNIVILQIPLIFSELKQLAKEFPQLLFMCFPRYKSRSIPSEYWHRTEVFFGEQLTAEQLEQAPQLRWIHTPTSNVNLLCLKAIDQRGNILISNTREENAFQVGEYVLSIVLAYAKNLFHWKQANKFPALVWDCKWRNNLWTLKNKIFLQIGMGKMGVEIARRAYLAGMKVWGMDERRSFHPFCTNYVGFQELHNLLPSVDIVSLAFPKDQNVEIRLNRKELELMKDDTILSILASSNLVDFKVLEELSLGGKFRGILWDAPYHTPVSSDSRLWNIPHLLITPDIATRPKTSERLAFRTFRFNLRQYLIVNFSEMKDLTEPSLAFIPESTDIF